MSLKNTSNPDHRFWGMLNEASLHQSEWRKRAETNLRYHDGDQWTKDELEMLNDRGQQPTVINICRPTIDTLHSIYVERKTDMQVVGREIGDDELGGILTDLLKQSFDQNNFSHQESQWFRSGALTGIGWVECKKRTKIRPDGSEEVDIDVNKVPFEEVYFDPFYRKLDGSDMRYVIRRRWVDLDQLRRSYPSKIDEIQQVVREFNDDSIDLQEKYAQGRGGAGSVSTLQHFDRKNNRIAVQEVWYFDDTRTLRHCIFTNNVFLKGGREDHMNEDIHGLGIIPLIPFISNIDRHGLPKGLLDWIIGIQDSINKMYSKWQWNMMTRQFIYEDSAVDDVSVIKQELAKPDGVIRVEDGGLGRIQIPKNIEESAHLSNMMQTALQMSQRISGINDALMGIGGVNARSAQQEASRQIQGSQMQTAIIENMLSAKRRLSYVMLMMMGKYYDQPRVVRTVGETTGKAEYYAINQPYKGQDGNMYEFSMEEALKYDVVLRVVPAFNTVRQNTLTIISEMAKAGAIPPQVAATVAIELADLPDKQRLLAEVKQFNEQQAQIAASQNAQAGG